MKHPSLESALTKSRSKDEMVAYMDTHPESFEEGIKMILANKQPLAWRAAWLIGDRMLENDKRLRKYKRQMMEVLTVANEGMQREVIKILYNMELNDKEEGKMFEHSVSLWKNIKIRPAVRFYAFKMLLKLADKYKELVPEVKLLASKEYIESLSPGVGRSVAKLVKAMKISEKSDC